MKDISVEFEKYISSNKLVLDILPVNTKKNRNRYIKQIQDNKLKAIKIKEILLDEIGNRCYKIINTAENPEISELKKEIEEIENLELLNEFNSPYEKLGIDKIIHNLNYYADGNLNLLNKNIKMFFYILSDCGIELTSYDFYYSDYTHRYIKALLKENFYCSEELNEFLQDIYFKCPDIITHIELNMRYLYYINSEKLKNELNYKISNLNKDRIIKKYSNLYNRLIKLENIDIKNIIEKFVTDEWKIEDYSNNKINKLYKKFLTKDYILYTQEEIKNTFEKLYYTLIEYDFYKKYKFIIDDLKNRMHKDYNINTVCNKIKIEEKKLFKNNEKYKRTIKRIRNPIFKFFSKKLERKLYKFPINNDNQIKEIKKLYLELDDENINMKISNAIDNNSSLYNAFKLATSFYTYTYNLLKQNCFYDDINITDELEYLKNFVNQPNKVMLNSVKLLDEENIALVICNEFKMRDVKLEKEDLECNFNEIFFDVQKIINYLNIKESNIKIEDIEFIQKVKEMLK